MICVFQRNDGSQIAINMSLVRMAQAAGENTVLYFDGSHGITVQEKYPSFVQLWENVMDNPNAG